MMLYREVLVEEWPNPIPEGWVYAGTDDEFGVLDRFMVPIGPGLFVTGDFDSVSDMLDAAVGPNRSVTFQWIGGGDG